MISEDLRGLEPMQQIQNVFQKGEMFRMEHFLLCNLTMVGHKGRL
jgi:hypothetical protein